MLILLFPYCFNSFFVIPVMIEETKLKFAVALPTTAAVTVTNGAMGTPSLVGDKKINALLK